MITNIMRSSYGTGEQKTLGECAFWHYGIQILILVDSYSKGIAAWVMSRSDTAAVIVWLDNFIETFGTPNIIRPDKAPPPKLCSVC
jgi:hypothetical protein